MMTKLVCGLLLSSAVVFAEGTPSVASSSSSAGTETAVLPVKQVSSVAEISSSSEVSVAPSENAAAKEPVFTLVKVEPVAAHPQENVSAPVMCPQKNVRETAFARPERQAQKARFGARLSVGGVEFFGDNDSDDNVGGMDLTGGLALNLPVTKYSTSFAIEAVFAYRHLTGTDAFEQSGTKDLFTQYQIDVPLYLWFRPAGGMVGFKIGPQVSANIYDKLEIYQQGSTVYSENLRSTSARSPVDLAVLLGLSFDASPLISFDLRAVFGLTDMYDNLYLFNADEYPSYTPIGFQIGMSYYFL
ncbi:MAG: PorT family protein [Fibrobacteraceae bacterium]|nr:PorT family protein [Fibrobacteraceae bacterium]